jgi:hypothetical protein
MVERKKESCVCCEELEEREATVEYGYEEPSEAVYPVEPGRPRITHMSGIKPERKKLGFLWKVVIAGILIVVTLVLGYILMATG